MLLREVDYAKLSSSPKDRTAGCERRRPGSAGQTLINVMKARAGRLTRLSI
jgi:hypothetical protein